MSLAADVPRGGRLTLAGWVIGDWLAGTAARVKPSTLYSYRRNMELHVLPVLGSCALAELTAQKLNLLYAQLLAPTPEHRGLSPKTVRYIHMTIHKALADAIDAGELSENAASRAKPPRPTVCVVSVGQVWDAGELAAFLEHVRGVPLAAVWRLAAMTGMRRGEVLGLRWADIDFANSRVAVRRARVAVGTDVFECSPKGGRARVIDIDVATVELLRQLRAARPAQSPGPGEVLKPGELVVVAESGDPLHPDAFSRAFRQLVSAAGLRPIRLHDLRHTHASLLLGAAVPVKVVSERLGHRSAAFTLTVYAHVIPGMQAEAATRIAELVSEASRPHAWSWHSGVAVRAGASLR